MNRDFLLRNVNGLLFILFLVSASTISAKDELNRYLLPKTHPLRPHLDQIFAQPDVLQSREAFEKAGFIILHNRPSGMRVATHPLLEGYLVKVCFDFEAKKQRYEDGITWMLHLCKGAENIRNLIKEKKMQHFSVPDKWIYMLPGQPFADTQKQVAVLLVTRMDLARGFGWEKMTKAQVKELFCILSAGHSSCTPLNIHITKDGKYACFDTEYPQRKFKLTCAVRFLSEEMKTYWNTLLERSENSHVKCDCSYKNPID